VVHHERAARALERLGILCYDVAKPMKECGCQETVFTNSHIGTKTGGRPLHDEWKESGERVEVECVFGVGKRRYSLNRIMMRLQHTSELAIHTSILTMNLWKKLRALLFVLLWAVLKKVEKTLFSVMNTWRSYGQIISR
jgi:hypothetical protein